MVIALRLGDLPSVWTGTEWTSEKDAVKNGKAKMYDEMEPDFSDLPADRDICFLQIPTRAKWLQLGVVSPAAALAMLNFLEQKGLEVD
jgi:hypothetical protein